MTKKKKKLRFQLLKREYCLVYTLHYDSKLNTFGLWTKKDI